MAAPRSPAASRRSTPPRRPSTARSAASATSTAWPSSTRSCSPARGRSRDNDAAAGAAAPAGRADLTSLPAADRPVDRRALAKNPDERFPVCLDLANAPRDGPHDLRRRGPPMRRRPRTSALGASKAMAAADDSRSRRRSAAANDATDIRGRSREARPKPWSERPAKSARPAGGGVAVQARTPGKREADGSPRPPWSIGLGQRPRHPGRMRKPASRGFGRPDARPHLDCSPLDTDPEASRRPVRGQPGIAQPGELLATPSCIGPEPLPARPRRQAVDSWLTGR